MSKIYVDEIAGIASPSTVAIPGHVIQVVEALKTDVYSESIAARSVGSAITGLSVSITPSSASSKLLVMLSLSATNATSGYRLAAVIYQNGSPSSFIGDSAGSRTRVTIGRTDSISSQNMMNNLNFTGVITAGSTSEQTFDVRLHNAPEGVTSTMYVNRQNEDSDVNYNTRAVSSLVVMEIAG